LSKLKGTEDAMIWFTADTHFGHKNIVEFCQRPFSSVAEMDNALIDNWNAVVAQDDTVYHLGDFTLSGVPAILREYVGALNGSIKIVPGGHDYRWLKVYGDGIVPVSRSGYDLEVLPPLYSLEIDIGSKYPLVVVLCHYAMRVFDRSHYGAYHLYGHSHGTLPGLGRSMDVGVDTNNFYPYSLDDIHSRLKDILLGTF
jgi:calcineurin-like phosphoesterase family protein